MKRKSVDYLDLDMVRNYIMRLPDGQYAEYSPDSKIVKMQNIEMPYEWLEDLCNLYPRNAYIVKGYNVYEVRRTAHGEPHLAKVYTKPIKDIPLVGRSRYLVGTAKKVNTLLGFKLFNEVV